MTRPVVNHKDIFKFLYAGTKAIMDCAYQRHDKFSVTSKTNMLDGMADKGVHAILLQGAFNNPN